MRTHAIRRRAGSCRGSSEQALHCALACARTLSEQAQLDTSVCSVWAAIAVARRSEADHGAPCQGFQGHVGRAAAHKYAKGQGDALVLGASCPAVLLRRHRFHAAHHPCITFVELLMRVLCMTLRRIAYAAVLSDKPHAGSFRGVQAHGVLHRTARPALPRRGGLQDPLTRVADVTSVADAGLGMQSDARH